MRIVLIAILACMLCGCSSGRDPLVSNASAVPAGNWRIERQVDCITGEPLPSAMVRALASNSAEQFPQPAMLQLTCFKDQPIIRLSFDFKIGSNKNATLGYRFDDKPGREIETARFLADFKVVVIEEKADVAQFVSELATSKTLYVRIRSLNAGRTAVEFRLDGAQAAIEAGYDGCSAASNQLRGRKST